jgi:hypothetical protein
MERVALTFNVKPGTEDQAAEIFASYARPSFEIDDTNRLLSTTIFMHGNMVVRVFDYEGDLPTIMRHLSTQPAIQEVERRLDPILEEPRDMTNPDGVRAFFAKAMMRRCTHRVAGEEVR